MQFKANVVVQEAKGIAVAAYAGAQGVAVVKVTDNSGEFSEGKPNGTITAELVKAVVRDADDTQIDVSSYLSKAKPVTATLDGWRYTQSIDTGSASVSMELEFGEIKEGQPPALVAGRLTATGKGFARLAFKSLSATMAGVLSE